MTKHSLMDELQEVAARLADGHLSILKFTTNWRVWFSTPMDRFDIESMPDGLTFEEAASNALEVVKDCEENGLMISVWQEAARQEAKANILREIGQGPSEIVEHVARAICIATCQEPDSPTLEGCLTWEIYIEDAEMHIAASMAIKDFEAASSSDSSEREVRH